jgi:hypothetical protein
MLSPLYSHKYITIETFPRRMIDQLASLSQEGKSACPPMHRNLMCPRQTELASLASRAGDKASGLDQALIGRRDRRR